MRPAWSVLLLTTLIGAGQGLFLALFASDLLFDPQLRFILWGAAISLALLAAGLLASFFHLGHPERAWRSAAMWRTSWLSREVIALPLFMGLVFLYGLFAYLGRESLVIGILATAACVALFICTGMIYACLKFLQEWHTPLTVVNYTMLGTASGLTAAAALSAWLQPALSRPFALAALVAGALAYLLRLASLSRNTRLRPKSTLASAIGVKHPRIVQIAQGAMGGSFNTREFFHGRPREVVRAVRWGLLALVFPVPALFLIFSSSPAMLLAAFLAQFAGMLAERWYFFAEARHPQNLYYQAIA
ncbi:MAG TPA: DmsC/YnfH family molybdoenzyme membrane anchor subunit [Burkholderiales bacterium]|nr:DmsC/YnfH family molybdoenzyme membrane anchor subunit [Burkholderiales bacterium]